MEAPLIIFFSFSIVFMLASLTWTIFSFKKRLKEKRAILRAAEGTTPNQSDHEREILSFRSEDVGALGVSSEIEETDTYGTFERVEPRARRRGGVTRMFDGSIDSDYPQEEDWNSGGNSCTANEFVISTESRAETTTASQQAEETKQIINKKPPEILVKGERDLDF